MIIQQGFMPWTIAAQKNRLFNNDNKPMVKAPFYLYYDAGQSNGNSK